MKHIPGALPAKLPESCIDSGNFAIILLRNYTCITAGGKFYPKHPFLEDDAPFYFINKDYFQETQWVLSMY
jgi:hypothetical protein